MKRKLSAILLAAFMVLCLFGLAGCGKYTTSYSAVGFVHSNLPGSAFMNFSSFSGRIVFKLDSKSGTTGMMKATAKLTSGSATVYYDDGEKKELFAVHAGDTLETTVGPFDSKTVYVIVETGEKCQDGAFTFDME